MIPMGSVSSTTRIAPTFFLVIISATSFTVVEEEQVINFFEYFTGCKSNNLLSLSKVSFPMVSPYSFPLWLLEYGLRVFEAKLSIKKLPTALFSSA